MKSNWKYVWKTIKKTWHFLEIYLLKTLINWLKTKFITIKYTYIEKHNKLHYNYPIPAIIHIKFPDPLFKFSKRNISLSRQMKNGIPNHFNMKKQKTCQITPYLQNDLVCGNFCGKMKKENVKYILTKQNWFFKIFEELLSGRSRKHIFLSTNMFRKIFTIHAFVLFIVNSNA